MCTCERRLSADFGQGWMTRNARDLSRILVHFGGVCPKALNIAVARRVGKSARTVNAATIEHAMNDLNQIAGESV